MIWLGGDWRAAEKKYQDRKDKKHRDKTNWHPKFCWLPHVVTERGPLRVWAWLQLIERRGEFQGGNQTFSWQWEYRLGKDDVRRYGKNYQFTDWDYNKPMGPDNG